MKKVYVFLIILILIIVSVFTIDYLLAKSNKLPFLAIKETKGNIKTYKGLFYQVDVCNSNVVFNENIICPKDADFVIVDETEVCAEALELFYEDENYKYYYPCIKNATTFIKKNNKKQTVKESLEDKTISVESLLKSGLSFIRKEKIQISVDKSDKCKTIKYQISNENSANNLYTYCLDSVKLQKGSQKINLIKYLAEGSNNLKDLAIQANLKKEVKDGYTLYKGNEYAILICKEKNYIGTVDILEKNVCNK